MRSLAIALIQHGRIQTTTAKAKELRPFIERLVTRSRITGVHGVRYLHTQLADDRAVKRLVMVLGPRFVGRPGGYTRITNLGPRVGDAGSTSLIEFV